jgi:hypothetical protein
VRNKIVISTEEKHALNTPEIIALRRIASIAHCGGLAGLSQEEALFMVRKLSLNYWNTNATLEEERTALSEAINQAKAVRIFKVK